MCYALCTHYIMVKITKINICQYIVDNQVVITLWCLPGIVAMAPVDSHVHIRSRGVANNIIGMSNLIFDLRNV